MGEYSSEKSYIPPPPPQKLVNCVRLFRLDFLLQVYMQLRMEGN